MQLLDTALITDEKEDMKEEIWTFFKKHGIKAITKYQVDEDSSGFESTSVESILQQAVKDVPTKKVRKNNCHVNLLLH